MHIFKFVQSHIIIFYQLVSVTPVTTIRASYKQNIINVFDIQSHALWKANETHYFSTLFW